MQPFVLPTDLIAYFIAYLFNFEPNETWLIFTKTKAVDLN
jgi:hypothetical protein